MSCWKNIIAHSQPRFAEWLLFGDGLCISANHLSGIKYLRWICILVFRIQSSQLAPRHINTIGGKINQKQRTIKHFKKWKIFFHTKNNSSVHWHLLNNSECHQKLSPSVSILPRHIIKPNKGQFTSGIYQNLFICLLIKYLLSHFYVSCTVLSAQVIAIDKTVKNPRFPRICIQSWETGNKKIVKIMSGNDKCYEDK